MAAVNALLPLLDAAEQLSAAQARLAAAEKAIGDVRDRHVDAPHDMESICDVCAALAAYDALPKGASR